jgi:phenylpyruvate tautomerase PptA (4-oxalocrotonate tautomerase family)
MPLVRISVPAHLRPAKTIALANAVHDALVATCEIPPTDRFQLISRFPPEAMIIDPTFPKVERSAEASIVEITFIAGKSEDMKRRLYHHIVTTVATAGFRPDDILVALTENARIDWSPGRGLAYEGPPGA